MPKPSTNIPTAKQQAIVDWVKQFVLTNGYGPTMQEIGEHFGIKSPSGATRHIEAAEKKGLIQRATDENGRALARAFVFPGEPRRIRENS